MYYTTPKRKYYYNDFPIGTSATPRVHNVGARRMRQRMSVHGFLRYSEHTSPKITLKNHFLSFSFVVLPANPFTHAVLFEAERVKVSPRNRDERCHDLLKYCKK